MLPQKMKVSEKAFNSLRRLQNNTGLTVNIGARLAFFASIERSFTWTGEDIQLTQRELDKYTWLGDYGDVIEMLLKQKYPKLGAKDYYKAWGSHVDDGATTIEGTPNITRLITSA
ncbi:DNA sulfur modification protein DndE [Halioxenophilus aromaticivorans]|uniref:DNA sulfur modification protein DndE n=1 Tax=Halioxenophilus aromaticivorans TaxID=1306992 RepID=A0AAV3U8Q0_9ALTE